MFLKSINYAANSHLKLRRKRKEKATCYGAQKKEEKQCFYLELNTFITKHIQGEDEGEGGEVAPLKMRKFSVSRVK